MDGGMDGGMDGQVQWDVVVSSIMVSIKSTIPKRPPHFSRIRGTAYDTSILFERIGWMARKHKKGGG